MKTIEGQRLADLSLAIRESTLRRLGAIPEGAENWRPSDEAMSFADIAFHIAEADDWLIHKLEEPSLAPICGRAHTVTVRNRGEYEALLTGLDAKGNERANLVRKLSEEDLSRPIDDTRFGGTVSVWWTIARGNLDHEAHHRGQLAAYIRIFDSAKRG